MITYFLAGVMYLSPPSLPGAIQSYMPEYVCDWNGDCDDDETCLEGGACYDEAKQSIDLETYLDAAVLR